jgi:hypothetical protein
VGGQRHAPAAFTPGQDPAPIVQKAGWAPGPVWIGADNLAPTGIRFPDLPARSESLYRLSYPGPVWSGVCINLSFRLYINVKHLTYSGQYLFKKNRAMIGIHVFDRDYTISPDLRSEWLRDCIHSLVLTTE